MKRVIIILGVIAVLVLGVFYITNMNNKKEPVKQKADPFEISLDQINSNMKEGSLLIDVRTVKEFKADRAVGAINIPVEDIQKGIYPQIDKEKIIYVYCRSGRRATLAKTALEKAGYKNVVNLKSLYSWVALNGKTEGSDPKCSLNNKANC